MSDDYLDFGDRETVKRELSKLYSALVAAGRLHYARQLITASFPILSGDDEGEDVVASLNETLVRIELERRERDEAELRRKQEADPGDGDDAEGSDLSTDS
jgi:hypothetical protein